MSEHEYFAAESSDSLERERLHALEAAKDPKTRRHMLQLGLKPGWSCLEVGAGGGSITRWLSEQVGPSGTVVAADIDLRFLQDQRFQRRCAQARHLGRSARKVALRSRSLPAAAHTPSPNPKIAEA
jgi:predicted methyltransferase